MANPNWKENLIDISTRPDFKEITSKGGSAKSEVKTISRQHTASAKAKCKNCKLDCEFRKACLAKDDESVCVVPTLRVHAIRDSTKVVGLSNERIETYLGEIIGMYKELLIENDKLEDIPKKLKLETQKDLTLFFDKLIQLKQAYHPSVQKSLKFNVDTTADKVIERIKEYKLAEIKNGDTDL